MGKRAGIVARHFLALAMGAKTAHEAIDEYRTSTYRITWVDDDGTVLDETEVMYGKMPEHDDPPAKPSTSEFDYEFVEWVPNVVPANKDAVYRARYLEMDRSGDAVPFDFYNHVSHMNCRFVTYYNDDYFNTPSTGYDPSLTTFALSLALSTGYKSEDPDGNSDYVTALLNDIGCERIMVNDYYKAKKKAMDNIGVAVGIKDIDIPTVFVAIKGCYYGAEFGGNLIMGTEEELGGRHKGFAIAMERAMEYIAGSIREAGLSGRIRMMVVGYSRGGAVTNLVTSTITDMISDGTVRERLGVDMRREDLYGFCFEPALCQHGRRPKDGRYDNIVCIIDPNDPVVKIPPAQYGFTLFGRINYLDSNNPDTVRRMKAYVDKYFGEGTSDYYNVTDFVPKSEASTLGEMLDSILGISVKSFGGRDRYVERMQDDVAYAVYAILDNLDEVRAIMASFDPSKISYADLMAMLFTKKTFFDSVAPYVNDFNLLTDTDTKKVASIVGKVFDLIKSFSPRDLLKVFQELKHNYKCVVTPHYPLGPLAYLMSDDIRYRL